jgi:DHA2 family multidrug resistance protein
MTSWLSQQFGRKYFAASVIIFTVFSFLCGNATNIWERYFPFVSGNWWWSTFGNFTNHHYGILSKKVWPRLSMGWVLLSALTLGPPLGGYIVDNYSWPYIFYINIPLGIIIIDFTICEKP